MLFAAERSATPVDRTSRPAEAEAVPCDAACQRRLRAERIVWLSTVDEEALPHVVPVWYVWDGGRFLIFSKPDARKVRAVRRQPRVALAVGEPLEDFDVQLIHGHATVLQQPAAELLDDELIGSEHARKYGAQMSALGLTRSEYAATYCAALSVVPIRYLPWRGRGPRRASPSARLPYAGTSGLA